MERQVARRPAGELDLAGSATMSSRLADGLFTRMERTGRLRGVGADGEDELSVRQLSDAVRHCSRPTMTARPATVGACQVREQLSTLLVPITARANFCIR
jgi:hypothetical protein